MIKAFSAHLIKFFKRGNSSGAQRFCNDVMTAISEETKDHQTEELSLADAHLRALVILAETEARIQLERQQEFSSLFADEDINT
jgi:hypothetical protein